MNFKIIILHVIFFIICLQMSTYKFINLCHWVGLYLSVCVTAYLTSNYVHGVFRVTVVVVWHTSQYIPDKSAAM